MARTLQPLSYALCAALLLVLYLSIPWPGLPPPPAPPLPPSLVCSHQGRLSPAPQHGPTTSQALFSALAALHARGIACFDLDLSPLPGGGSAVGHPAALAAAGAGGAADGPQLLAHLASALPGARLTLELKAPLGEDAALVAALAEAARRGGLLPRLALLGLPPGAPLPRGLQRGLAVRDDRDCSLSGLGSDVAVVMPSHACWARQPVREAILQWSAAAAAGAGDSAMAGEVHVWVVDDAALARSVLGRSEQLARLRLVSNHVGALLGAA